jgi:hypothetical protein
MMKRFTTVVRAIVALTITNLPAAAMDYSWRSYKDKIVIDASGPIVVDEAKNFIAWVEQSRREWNGHRATAIVFNSPGGSIEGGRQMGIIIADFHMTTGVSHGGECASACVLIWSAGEFKSAGSDSKIGVHMAKDMNGEPTVDGTIFGLHWLEKTHAPNSVVVGAMSTKPDHIYWLSESELISWGAKIVPEEPVASKSSVDCRSITDSLERLECWDKKSASN